MSNDQDQIDMDDAGAAHQQELEGRRQGIQPKRSNPWAELDRIMDEGMPYYVKVRDGLKSR